MSISKKTPEQLEGLKATLKAGPHIAKAYFDKNGNHFFNSYESDGKNYSRVEQQRVVTGYRGKETVVKTVDKPKPENEIAETLTRQQVLSYTPNEAKESKTSSK